MLSSLPLHIKIRVSPLDRKLLEDRNHLTFAYISLRCSRVPDAVCAVGLIVNGGTQHSDTRDDKRQNSVLQAGRTEVCMGTGDRVTGSWSYRGRLIYDKWDRLS